MKISVDLDGCLYDYPEFFRLVQLYCMELGYEFGILTSHRDIRQHADMVLLNLLGIEPDFFYSRSILDLRESEEFKTYVILNSRIDYHFDDCEYGKFTLPNTILVPSTEEYDEPADFFHSFSI